MNVTLHPHKQAIWGNIWKRTVEKRQTFQNRQRRRAKEVQPMWLYNVESTSSQAGELRKRLKTHSGEKTNKCNQCDFASSHVWSLKAHLKTHSGEKPNKCNRCEYASSFAGNLRQHLKTHSGEKSNKCNQCDYSSSQASNLRRHLKTHSV